MSAPVNKCTQNNLEDSTSPIANTQKTSSKQNKKHDIRFDEYMNALSCISGISTMELEEKINKLSLKHKKTLLDYCNRGGSSCIPIIEKFIKQIGMKTS